MGDRPRGRKSKFGGVGAEVLPKRQERARKRYHTVQGASEGVTNHLDGEESAAHGRKTRERLFLRERGEAAAAWSA